MITSDTFNRLQNQLIEEEGLRTTPYIDSLGNQTNGIGWNMNAMPLTKAQALAINSDHIHYFDDQLHQRLPFYDELDEVRKAVLIDMAFNMGINNFMLFNKFFNLLSVKSWQAAAADMLDTKWAKQVGYRAQHLSKMIESGEWLPI